VGTRWRAFVFFGLAEMALALADNREHRTSGELALHVLDIMEAITLAAGEGETRQLTTTVARPVAVGHARLARD
jgi:predicted dehydrogenase